MAAAAERRPDVMELYLVSDSPASPIVGAMGAACAALALGDQDERIPIAGAALRPMERADREQAAILCPLLWRVQGTQDRDLLQRTVLAFAAWMTTQRRFRDLAPSQGYVERLVPFAARVLHEWLHQRCGRCGGSGLLQITARGVVRTLGSNARNTRFARCQLCHGLGNALMRPAEQAAALGLPMAVYEAAGWHAHFRVGRAWLLRLLRKPRRHLRRELGLL